jgi:hypothetical protein
VTGTVAESAGRQDTSAGLGIDQTPELSTGLENPPAEVTVPGVELRLGGETEIENENRQETRIESETESEVEQRLESRREIETEQETRIENRVEQEAEPFEEIESVLSSSDRIGFNPLVSQSATDFLNPLTGERRETTLFQNE